MNVRDAADILVDDLLPRQRSLHLAVVTETYPPEVNGVAYLRRFHNRTACTMVPTETLRRELDGCGFERLTVVARGVDTQRFDPARRCEALRQSWGCAPADRVLIYVGRLAPEKNLELLLRCHAQMVAVAPTLRQVFVGDGPARAALQARCPAAIYAGPRSGDELAAHYASGDLFLFPSLTETYGNVTTEALASGLAVLAFDHAAAAHLIRDGNNGLLAPLGDEKAFVERAVRLAAQPDEARALRPRARQTMLGHGWPRIVAQVEAVMSAAARPGRPGCPASIVAHAAVASSLPQRMPAAHHPDPPEVLR